MTEKSQNFLIFVTIIEGRHFTLMNMDSLVHIRIGKQRKSTGVRKATDSPYFNEYFVFEFNRSLTSLLDEQLVLTMIQPRKIWRKRKTIGYFSLDIATVWSTPEHQFYHKWAVISAGMHDKKPGPKGYLKIDVGILSKGQIPHFPVTTNASTDDDLEENMLLPENVSHDRSRANFIFYVYNAEEIPKVKGSFPSTFVQITYAGLTGKTSVKKSTQNPVWNEKIVITELFPSLCQRIKIELQYIQNVPPIVHYIYLKTISNEGENGFLPMFGPSYIYLYTSDKFEVNYNGKLLLEIKTEILTDLMWSTNAVEIYPIREITALDLWNIEPVLLYCNIYSVTMMEKKYKDKQISFEITMGAPVMDIENCNAESVTIPIKSVADNMQCYWYLPYNEEVVCLSMVTPLRDTKGRIYNTNMIRKIFYLLEDDLEQIEKLFEHQKKNIMDISSRYIEIAEKLQRNCRNYLNLANSSTATKTNLDKKKLQLCISEIEDVEANISNLIHYQGRKKVYRKLLSVLHRIYKLIDNVHLCWPDVFIWMISGNKRVGYHRVHVKNIIYSPNSEEKGLLCGILQNIHIKPINKSKIKLTFGENSAVLCRMCVQLWVGLMADKDECLNTVSDCFVPLEMSEKYEIPKKYLCNNVQKAICKCYLYQGRFEPGADNSGLSDPFVKVVFNEHVLVTKMVPKTIHPIWNETLIFHNILLYGSIEFLTKNTPTLVLEAYDQDMLYQTDYLGRSFFVPEITAAVDDKALKLKWVTIYNGERKAGEFLMAAELIWVTDDDSEKSIPESYYTVDSIPDNIKPSINSFGLPASYYRMDTIPDSIKPTIKSFRLDVYFWGVHDLKRVQLRTILKPKITVECGGTTLHSTTLQNTKKYLNFPKPYQSVYVSIPANEQFYPPLSINMFDCRGFGWYIFVGTYLAMVQDYIYKPITKSERDRKLLEGEYAVSLSTESSGTPSFEEIHVNKDLRSSSVEFDMNKFKFIKSYMKRRLSKSREDFMVPKEEQTNVIDLNLMDWWTKFYISAENSEIYKTDRLKEKLKIKIYSSELERAEEFNHFNDLLHTFKLYRGKRTGDDVLDAENIIGIFKGAIRIYRWPPPDDHADEFVTETGHPLRDGSFQHYPVNEPVSYVARVYVIRAFNLRPKDLSGKSDPYISVKLGEVVIYDRENYVPNNVQPVFGRCFELKGVFPNDTILTVGVWDMDISTADDFIGETTIDLENRLFTNHRGSCGLPNMYIEKGPCAWRDQYKPSQILEILCRRNNIGEPEYSENAVKVGPCIFADPDTENESPVVKKEILSLLALNNWQDIPVVGCPLVPEHVETRSLYHYSKPGIEQGKLQLWVDIFPRGEFAPPPPVDVNPRKAVPYQLRVIIWNTDEVILEEDDFFIGERKSDIYVKGWITGPEESQCTDVHYNSISGEGNFNWRFIFSFFYQSAEDKIVVKKKTSVFSADATEFSLPCFLHLQVWDNDTFSPDDFLGSLKLSLCHLPRGAKTAKLCTLNILQPGAPTVNLFKTKRHKGWWPFRGKEDIDDTDVLTGKVEAEIELLTEEEYILGPAGLGRNDPQRLPEPKRPDISFSWFRNPWKALKFLVCKRFRFQIIIIILLSLLTFMFLVAIYAFPNYTVKRIIGA